MAEIRVLDKNTIDQIAAGEVVERPSSVVKELTENALDAGATAVTVEIKNGGIDLVRITDNGSGIEPGEIRTAFLRHATSKIRKAEDIFELYSLGFRGEALSSIASVSRLEVITKVKKEISGVSYVINGGEEISMEDIGAPEGTTFLVRDLFYNTPARRKFLKTPITETSYIADLLEHMALSHPDVSFRFISNGQTKLSTPGNGKVKDLIYTLYGRDTANALQEISYDSPALKVTGFLGKPVLSKGNRGFENYFVNGRYVKSNVIASAIEEAYAPFMMQHRYPFTVLYFELPPEDFDVNVHPTKMELRFRKEGELFAEIKNAVSMALSHKEFAPEVELSEEKKPAPEKLYRAPEPFEVKRLQEETGSYVAKPAVSAPGPENAGAKAAEPVKPVEVSPVSAGAGRPGELRKGTPMSVPQPDKPEPKPEEMPEPQPDKPDPKPEEKPAQLDLFGTGLLSEEGMKKYRLIGQVFDTYWLIELGDKLYIMDQHAAHEKVLFERKMKELKERKPVAQNISPPITLTLSGREELVLNRFMSAFSDLGYEISAFGGREYAISAVPDDLYGLDVKELFTELLADLESELSRKDPDIIYSRIATASCKAAVKGNQKLSFAEADKLIAELFTLENPYACPHGRPTLITLTERELEKKFKRII